MVHIIRGEVLLIIAALLLLLLHPSPMDLIGEEGLLCEVPTGAGIVGGEVHEMYGIGVLHRPPLPFRPGVGLFLVHRVVHGGVTLPPLEPVGDLLMEDVEEHGREGHPKQDVKRTKPLCPLVKFLQLPSLMRATVTETDCCEGEEAEVEAV